MSLSGIVWSRWVLVAVLILVAVCAGVVSVLVLRMRRAPKGPKHAAVEQTMYQRLGTDAIRVVVDQFYRRILDDPETRRYFAGMSFDSLQQLKGHQAAFISQLLGGPVVIELERLRRCHARLIISNDVYTNVVGKLYGVLCGLLPDNKDEDIILHLLVSLEKVRRYIVTQDHRFAEIGRGM